MVDVIQAVTDQASISRQSARQKLAYLLGPTPDSKDVAKRDEQEQEKLKLEEESETTRALREEVARLREQLEIVPRLLGIRSWSCGGCGSADVVPGRAFVESQQLFCQNCWQCWEQCGWWASTMRVCATPPSVGPSGFPEWAPEDAYFVPEMLAGHFDFTLLRELQAEVEQLEDRSFSEWHGARHLGLQFTGPDVAFLHSPQAPPVLQRTVEFLEASFGMRASAVRLNVYRSSSDYKPFHADRGQDELGTPQVTVGLSLGASRSLALTHWQTGLTLNFPQHNGDVFAFTPELNTTFLHGVPRLAEQAEESVRMSLILWGALLSKCPYQ
mmetsp:Transcript_61428/g.146445  ORF Transcript_61428/g.146445 Transcript_61428/m.146445 type:complete len:328 (-) Transcript_61428:94-1077(-)